MYDHVFDEEYTEMASLILEILRNTPEFANLEEIRADRPAFVQKFMEKVRDDCLGMCVASFFEL